MKLISRGTLGLAAMLALSPLTLEAQNEAPKGWVGVLITTGIGEANASGRLVFRDYPVIESIDPGSPAEKAGLRAGDILISINAQDFKLNPIPMNELLVPGRRITFRYLRDNAAKVSKMIVAERPAGTTKSVEVSIRPVEDIRAIAARKAATEGVSRQVQIRERIPVAPSVSMVPLVFGNGTTSIAIAGADMTQLNDGLRKALKINGDGIFVINVTVPSLAAQSGLESGDVIIRANKASVENPGQLIRMMIEATQSSVNQLALQVLRNQKQQNVVLRW